MQKNFIRLIINLIILALLSGCIRKQSEKEIEQSLTVAMNKYLNSDPRVDSTKSKFNVVDVIFFEDKNFYECEFKVHLVSPTKDTTGVMTASISKDFERVNRKF